MRLVVDTGVFSAGLRSQPPAGYGPVLTKMVGQQIFLAVHTVAELRFGALAAEWGEARRGRLEGAIAAGTVVPVSDALLHRVARLRLQCRKDGHPLADRVHTADLWIAASALHIGAAVLTLDQVFGGVPDLVLA